MKRMRGIVMLYALLLVGPGVVLAQEYALSWTSVISGRGISAGGAYTLKGTLGQPEAGQVASGDGYTLSGGLQGGGDDTVTGPDGETLYLPTVRR
jgi:hypothetical protein